MIGYLRYSDYYGMTKVQQELYNSSKNNKKFRNLYNIIVSNNNILMAYRSIKSNKGSLTCGVDNKNINYYKNLSEDEFVNLIKDRFKQYTPNPVKRIEIPKPYDTSKKRPLGIPTIEDRIIQQAILQVLEPICEAKFYKHNYGFRKNRGTIDAKARAEHLINAGRLYYCVDIDIKGFFDNVNHSKLLKQIYSMGIVDKKVLAIISKMLKAPIIFNNKRIISSKGVPQGGILSPLLSNIVLNELDQWIVSCWENIPTKFAYKWDGDKRSVLKKTKLKEQYIVRYADDFKIFCRNYNAAKRIYIATKRWLNKRLQLEISEKKSKITNLKTNCTTFLGFDLKATKNKKKTNVPYVAHSSINKQRRNLMLQQIRKEFRILKKNTTIEQIQKINSIILGWQNYYQYASRCSLDFKWISFRLFKWYYHHFPKILKEINKENIENNVFLTRYYSTTRKIYGLGDYPIFPIDIISCKVNKCHSQTEIFTTLGRNKLIKSLKNEVEYIAQLMADNPIETRSTEYNDNRISKYTMQNGRCGITGLHLGYSDIHCHHKKPYYKSKDDSFSNLIILHKDIHILLHMKDQDVITKSLTKFRLNKNKLQKFWELWEMCQ